MDRNNKKKEVFKEPLFTFKGPNEPVLLYEGIGSLKIQENSFEEKLEVWLKYYPRPRIEITMKFPTNSNTPDISIDSKNISVVFKEKSSEISVSINSIQSNSEDLVLKFVPEKDIVTVLGDYSTQINAVIFHLSNFTKFLGPKRNKEPFMRNNNLIIHFIDHMGLKWKDWIIEIKSLTSTNDTFKILNQDGGYGFTHFGIITKNKNKSFSVKDGNFILQSLRYILSFAKGVWCPPLLCLGFDKEGRVVWECWNTPKDFWNTTLSWFDPHHSKQLLNLFPGFMDRWTDKSWRMTFSDAIYWYLKSCLPFRGTDAGLILTQTAIERLSFEYAVNDKKLISKEGFKQLRASDKFRLLFSSLEIPLNIPQNLKTILKLAKQFNWEDSPHALTEIRNSLVHPEHKHQGKYDRAIFDAWNLSLWYLELSILKLCGYHGTYSNRLKTPKWAGEVEDVP